MKKLLFILFLICLISCEKQPQPVYVTNVPEVVTDPIIDNTPVRDTNYVFGYVDADRGANFIEEIKYKGHLYLYTRQYRNGVALTHAGHCHCNKNK